MTPDDDEWNHRIERIPATKGDIVLFHVDPAYLADVESFVKARRGLSALGIHTLTVLVNATDAIMVDAYGPQERERLQRDLTRLLEPLGLTIVAR